jgi:hypothetical protein
MSSAENRTSSRTTNNLHKPNLSIHLWHEHHRPSIPRCSQSVISAWSPKSRRSMGQSVCSGWNPAFDFLGHIVPSYRLYNENWEYDQIRRPDSSLPTRLQPLFPIRSSRTKKDLPVSSNVVDYHQPCRRERIRDVVNLVCLVVWMYNVRGLHLKRGRQA